jgi:SSS family solute:Na+ symporter
MKEFLPPVMLGVVFMGAIAAIHSTAAPYIGTGGSILLRDVYWRYIRNQKPATPSRSGSTASWPPS